MMKEVEPTIVTITEKKLIGQKLTMSLAENRTSELWQSFMQKRKEVKGSLDAALYSIQVYDSFYFQSFDYHKNFDKWAAMQVLHFDHVPDEMETFTLPEGLYAVFHYKGASTDNRIFQYIFTYWLPHSAYTLDNRPHFELLGEKYKNGDPASEEDIYIPIRLKE